MSRDQSISNVPNRKLLIGIAVIPTIDCFCNQLNNALGLGFGSISLLQAMRSFLLLVFAYIIVRALVQDWSSSRRIPLPAIGAILIVGMAASKELMLTGGLSIASIGAYGQMAYWVVLWTMVSILCRTGDQGLIVLRGLAWGAGFTAVSVILGLFFGTTNYYKSSAVAASAGWFDTAKMITGLLVVGGIVILYLGREKGSWLSCFGAGLCFAACVLTYARAGTVALGAALLWFVIWRVIVAKKGTGKWMNRFLAVVVVACTLVPLTANMPRLLSRWSGVSDSDTGGSGRATFWKVAIDYYASESESTETFGIGYSAMSEMLLRNYGDDIKHTHNDMFDMLLVGGCIGGLWLVSLVCAFVRRALLPPMRSMETAAGIAIVLAYLCHSQLTGQIWGTDAMTYYTLSLTGLSSMAVYDVISEKTPVFTREFCELPA